MVLDTVVIIWVLGWIVTGAFLGYEVARLRSLSDTLEQSSRALDQTAGGLDELRNVPFVGGRIGHIAGQVQATSASAKANAAESRSAVGTLAWLLGLVIAVIPGVPTLGFYLPYRFGAVFERRAIQAALRDPARRHEVDEYLAHRALEHWSFRDLQRVTPTPWRDVQEGRFAALAAAQRERLRIAEARET